MSEALQVIEQPLSRPPGVTPRQWRLAALKDRCDSAYDACIQAGYKPSVALTKARRTSEAVGVRRAMEAQANGRADSARGLVGIGKLALESAPRDLKELEPRDRIAAGFKAYELAANLGENLEVSGDADQHRARIRKAIRRGFRAGFASGLAHNKPGTIANTTQVADVINVKPE